MAIPVEDLPCESENPGAFVTVICRSLGMGFGEAFDFGFLDDRDITEVLEIAVRVCRLLYCHRAGDVHS